MTTDTSLGQIQYTYTLNKRINDGIIQYQWIRSDGASLSPILTTIQNAMVYADKMPMISDKEWITVTISDKKKERIVLTEFNKL